MSIHLVKKWFGWLKSLKIYSSFTTKNGLASGFGKSSLVHMLISYLSFTATLPGQLQPPPLQPSSQPAIAQPSSPDEPLTSPSVRSDMPTTVPAPPVILESTPSGVGASPAPPQLPPRPAMHNRSVSVDLKLKIDGKFKMQMSWTKWTARRFIFIWRLWIFLDHINFKGCLAFTRIWFAHYLHELLRKS